MRVINLIKVIKVFNYFNQVMDIKISFHQFITKKNRLLLINMEDMYIY